MAVFTRKTSGIVRSVTLFDAFLFGVTLAIPFAANFFLFPLYTYFLPGADWTLAVIIGLVLSIPNWILYAGMGSMMPRSGGDYVFQSRGVHALLPVVSVLAWTVFLLIPVYTALMCFASATLGVVPLLTTAGVVTNNSSMLNLASWILTPNGLFTFTTIVIVIAFFNNVVGIKWVSRGQRWILLPAMLISGVTIPVLLFSTSTATFTSNFNYYTQALNGTSGAYTKVLTAAGAAATPSFSLWHTFLVGSIIAIAFLMWAVWSAPVFGEMKGASNLRGLLFAFVAGALFQAFFLILPEFASFQNMVGSAFMNAVANQVYTGFPTLAFYPSMGMLTLMATTNVGVMILASVGFIVAGYFIVQMFYANLSRYLLAASIDGVIPAWFSSTSKRFKSPVNALIGVFVLYFLFAIVMDLVPSNFAFWETVAIWTSGVLFLGTGLAGVFIPWTNKAMYKASPIAKYPGLLVLAGALAFLFSGFILVGYVVIPELEIGLGPLGGLIIVVAAILAIAWYEFFRLYQKRKGIDIGLAYKELPPE